MITGYQKTKKQKIATGIVRQLRRARNLSRRDLKEEARSGREINGYEKIMTLLFRGMQVAGKA